MKYYLFGHPIGHSLSPLIHNTAYFYTQLPYEYKLCETLDIEHVVQILREKDVMGGSITIPHKEKILSYLDDVSDDVKKIGAVNTVKKEGGKLVGYNTDWEGIKMPLETHLQKEKKYTALVLGAGGAARAVCYALSQMKIPFCIYNRTKERAEKLATAFSGCVIDDYNDHETSIIINTLPLEVELSLKNGFLKTVEYVFDIVYMPYMTPLLAEAKKKNIETIHGIEMLLSQGYRQFEIWTGEKAPEKEIETVVLAKLLS